MRSSDSVREDADWTTFVLQRTNVVPDPMLMGNYHLNVVWSNDRTVHEVSADNW